MPRKLLKFPVNYVHSTVIEQEHRAPLSEILKGYAADGYSEQQTCATLQTSPRIIRRHAARHGIKFVNPAKECAKAGIPYPTYRQRFCRGMDPKKAMGERVLSKTDRARKAAFARWDKEV